MSPRVAGLSAHPFLEAVELPVSPLVAAVAAGAVVLAVAYGSRTWSVAERGRGDPPLESWAGPLRRQEVAGRAAALAVVALAVAAGRLGPPQELLNLAPALTIGVLWPLLVAGSAAVGPLWRWVDPWDGAARPLEAVAGADAARTGPIPAVYPAALVAAGWTWFVVAYPGALRPRTLALVLGAYSIAAVAGAVAFGRRRWLGSAEPLGLLLAWSGRLRRGRLDRWAPPPGAGLVVGAATGGLAFGLVRASSLWAGREASPDADLLATAGVLAASLLGAGILASAERMAGPRGAGGTPTAATVPAFVAVALALAIARDRLFTAVQAVPIAATDPFGLGWDLLGTADWGIRPGPFGPAGRAGLQAAILLAGHVLGAMVLVRRVPRPRDRDAGALVLALVAALSVASVVAV